MRAARARVSVGVNRARLGRGACVRALSVNNLSVKSWPGVWPRLRRALRVLRVDAAASWGGDRYVTATGGRRSNPKRAKPLKPF